MSHSSKNINILIVPDIYAFYRHSIFKLLSDYAQSYGYKVFIACDLRHQIKNDLPLIDKETIERDFINTINISSFDLLRVTIYQFGLLKSFFNLRPSLVIAWGDAYRISTWILLFICKLNKVPIVLWSHGLYGRENILLYCWRVLFYTLSDEIWLYGWHSAMLFERFPSLFRKSYIIGNSLLPSLSMNSMRRKLSITCHEGIPISDRDTINLLFVGRLNDKKGLIKALTMLNNYITKYSNIDQGFINIHWTICGNGPLLPLLMRFIDDYNLSPYVSLIPGTFEKDKLMNLFFESDIYYQPNGLGLGGYNAQYHGLPIITSSNYSNQMPEVDCINDENGSFYDENSSSSFFDALKAILTLYNKNNDLKMDISISAYNTHTPLAHFNRIKKLITNRVAKMYVNQR